MRFEKTRKLLKEKGYNEFDQRLKKCPAWLRKSYISEINYCEETGVIYDLEIHRIKRGNRGGLYTPDNVKILTKERHKLHHAMEKGCGR